MFRSHSWVLHTISLYWPGLLIPATGLTAEAGSSVSFVNRSEHRPIQLTSILTIRVVGVAKANELLIFGKKKTAQELLEWGFYK